MYNISIENGKIIRSRKINNGTYPGEEIEVFTPETFALCKIADQSLWLTAESALAQAHPGSFLNHCILAGDKNKIYIWNGTTYQIIDAVLKEASQEEKRILISRVARQLAACGVILNAKQSYGPDDQLEEATRKNLTHFYAFRCEVAQAHYLASRCDFSTNLCVVRNDELLCLQKGKYVSLNKILKTASEAKVTAFLKSLAIVAAELHYIITAVDSVVAA